MFTLHWAGRVVYGYFLLGDLVSGLLPTEGEGGLHEYSSLGEWVGLYVYFPLGKLVSGLLPAGGEGGLHGYSLPGERVGLIYFLLGSWFYGYFPLGTLV